MARKATVESWGWRVKNGDGRDGGIRQFTGTKTKGRRKWGREKQRGERGDWRGDATHLCPTCDSELHPHTDGKHRDNCGTMFSDLLKASLVLKSRPNLTLYVLAALRTALFSFCRLPLISCHLNPGADPSCVWLQLQWFQSKKHRFCACCRKALRLHCNVLKTFIFL